jgi:hypothetical protein
MPLSLTANLRIPPHLFGGNGDMRLHIDPSKLDRVPDQILKYEGCLGWVGEDVGKGSRPYHGLADDVTTTSLEALRVY